jgi:CBS domain-containing protein
MLVAELMTPRVTTIPEDATVAEAVEAFADAHVSAMPVVDDRGRALGVLSTSDLLQAEAEARTPPERTFLFERTRVRDLMTPRPLVVKVDASVREAAQHMLYLEVHRVFVEDEGRVVGVLSQTDVVRALATGRL